MVAQCSLRMLCCPSRPNTQENDFAADLVFNLRKSKHAVQDDLLALARTSKHFRDSGDLGAGGYGGGRGAPFGSEDRGGGGFGGRGGGFGSGGGSRGGRGRGRPAGIGFGEARGYDPDDTADALHGASWGRPSLSGFVQASATKPGPSDAAPFSGPPSAGAGAGTGGTGAPTTARPSRFSSTPMLASAEGAGGASASLGAAASIPAATPGTAAGAAGGVVGVGALGAGVGGAGSASAGAEAGLATNPGAGASGGGTEDPAGTKKRKSRWGEAAPEVEAARLAKIVLPPHARGYVPGMKY